MSVLDKVKSMLKGHESQAGQAVDKAGDMIDSKTDGKYASQVDMVQDQAKKQLGVDEQPPPPADGGQPAP
ncbi:antitoxin [Streptacidiphilus rugosus]|uniref:antitoxin n=1 Tax=Streptacidiphilus rugosus TaxID=405783 RepID=UPI0005619AC2|nr:antitoxin [Streptacidiphilus rugosus]